MTMRSTGRSVPPSLSTILKGNAAALRENRRRREPSGKRDRRPGKNARPNAGRTKASTTEEVGMQRDESTGMRRILVVANETVAGRDLLREIERRAAEGPHEVLVVSPALAPRIRFLVSDVDGGIRAAEERVRTSVEALSAAGVNARGEVGDSDPILAIEDALCQFAADEIIISTHPRGRSNWLEKKVVKRAENRFEVPLTHVVVDLAAEGHATAAGASAERA